MTERASTAVSIKQKKRKSENVNIDLSTIYSKEKRAKNERGKLT